MNVKKLNKAIETAKEEIGAGLVATDIYSSSDGQVLVGYNSQPKAAALFTSITDFIINGLKKSQFPAVGKYYMIDLANDDMIFIIPLGEYEWGFLIDSNKVQLGLFLNVILPSLLEKFEDALS